MIRINPDPHAYGYQYEPTRAVTAIFPAARDAACVLRALADAGLDRGRVDVFSGSEGADRLDPEGKHHGPWVRLRRFVTGQFDEGREVLHKAEATLRAGGTVVEVFTDGEPARKERAADVLKSAGGADVMYWGRLMAEYM
jgi:hypothetical protein